MRRLSATLLLVASAACSDLASDPTADGGSSKSDGGGKTDATAPNPGTRDAGQDATVTPDAAPPTDGGTVADTSVPEDAPRETSADAETGDAELRDGAAPADGGDASTDAATPSLNCERLEYTGCAAVTPYCYVRYNNGLNKEVSTCVASPDGPGLNQVCDTLLPRECGDGLACGILWTEDYRCLRTCKDNAGCPQSGTYCNHMFDFEAATNFHLGVCEACDPVGAHTNPSDPNSPLVDCPTGQSCQVRSTGLAPECGTTGSAALGAACASSTECGGGLLCVCNSDKTKAGAQCDASGGTCRRACHPWSRGLPYDCPGGADICTGMSGAYAYCKPPGDGG